jgi:hypothetical protein
MLYVCFHGDKSTGYPPQTPKAINTLFGGLDTKERAWIWRRMPYFLSKEIQNFWIILHKRRCNVLGYK